MSAQKTETNYNSNKNFPSDRKRLVVRVLQVVGVIAAAVLILFFLVPKAVEFGNSYTTSEVVSVFAVIISVGTIIVKICEQILRRSYDVKKCMSVNTDFVNGYSVVSCSITNRDNRRVIPQNIYLILEQGIETDAEMIDFPFLLKHETGKDDCILGSLCKQGQLQTFPDYMLSDNYKNLFRKIIRLKHLCAESRRYIDPGEEFSEDIVIKLPPGVYRATVIWTSVKDDCICALKEFVVPPTNGNIACE